MRQRFALFAGTDLSLRIERGVSPTDIVGCFIRQSDALLATDGDVYTWWCIVDIAAQKIVQEWQA